MLINGMKSTVMNNKLILNHADSKRYTKVLSKICS